MKVSESLQTAYDGQYDDRMTAWRTENARIKGDNVLQLVAQQPCDKLLEVGCGDGAILAYVADKGLGNVRYGADISASALAQLHKRNIPQLAEAVQFDGYSLPYPDKYFDLVICSHVLEHVEYERSLLREIARVSHRCCLEVPLDHKPGVSRKLKALMAYGHINVYTPESFLFLLGTEGFAVRATKHGYYSAKVWQQIAGSALKGTLVYAKKRLLGALGFPHSQAATFTVLANCPTEPGIAAQHVRL
jgi:ubiquinone/menaquinone biosynthesis C-methylase UbiE